MKAHQSSAAWLVVVGLACAAPFALAQQPAAEPAPQAPPAASSEPAAPPATADGPAPATAPATSEAMPNAVTQALILGIVDSNSRAVAVGERGQVLVSESRSDWRQVDGVPTRATLTAVDAVGENVWAVGHDGTILHSGDGGLNWTLQRVDVLRPPSDDEEWNPRQGVPLLDILMLNAQHGFAIGAYSLMLRTDDGGATWTPVNVTAVPGDQGDAADDTIADEAPAEGEDAYDDENWTIAEDELVLDEESDPHFNGIVRTGSGALFIVAERGAGFRSRDGGTTWERIQLPYQGSMFGAIGFEGDHLLAYGMRGNAFETTDLGDNWTELTTGTDLSLMGGAALPDAGVVLVGVNGIVLHRSSAAAPLTSEVFSSAQSGTPVLASVLARGGTDLVVSGEKGVSAYKMQQQ